MKAKKFTALVLSFVLVFGLVFALQPQVGATWGFGRDDFMAAAQMGLNYRVEERRAEIEQRFGVNIRYDIDPGGAASIGTGALRILEASLESLTPEVVHQLSDYWQWRTGNRITFSFTYSPFQSYAHIIGGEVLGSFSPSTAVISLFIPAFAADVYISGESPLTVMHELGHAFQMMLFDLHGEERLRTEWESFNGAFSYTGRGNNTSNFNRLTFISQYSTTCHEEDFAEVFAHAFVRHRAGQGFSNVLRYQDGSLTALGRKVNYIEELLAFYFDDTEQMIENYRRVWTAPIVLEYGNLRLSGDYTQYMGFTHPRFVLRSLVDKLDIEMADYQWMRHLGGWIITDTSGQQFAIFPGGVAFEFNYGATLLA